MSRVLSASHDDAYKVGYQLILCASLILLNILFIFGVFTGYQHTGASVLSMTTDKIQELGILSDTEDEPSADKKNI